MFSKLSNIDMAVKDLLDRLIRFKVYVQRFATYFGIANFLMLVNITFSFLPLIYRIAIIIFSLFAIIIWGYLDKRLGIFKAEQSFYNSQNPEIQRIEEKLNKLLQEKK